MKKLNHQRKGFQDAGDALHGSALQEVEQEREVAYEVEIASATKASSLPASFIPRALQRHRQLRQD